MLNQLTSQHGAIQSDRPVETAAARKWIRGGKLSSTSQSGDFRWNWSSGKKPSLFSWRPTGIIQIDHPQLSIHPPYDLITCAGLPSILHWPYPIITAIIFSHSLLICSLAEYPGLEKRHTWRHRIVSVKVVSWKSLKPWLYQGKMEELESVKLSSLHCRERESIEPKNWDSWLLCHNSLYVRPLF